MPNAALSRRIVSMRSIGLATTIAFGASLALTGAASAKPATLHLYSKTLSVNMYQANGQPLTDPNAAPVAGEYYSSTDIDYPGNNKHHSSTSSGYDHLVCTFTSVTSTGAEALCDAEVSYNGSLLYGDHFPLAISFTRRPGIESPNCWGYRPVQERPWHHRVRRHREHQQQQHHHHVFDVTR